MKRLIRTVAVILLAAASALVTASPAQAGGWATTLLDPVPERLEPGRTYTIGYWVLQHGSHPYEGDLGTTGLRMTDDAGTSIMYTGTRLPEAAHYAAAVVFDHAGTWRLTGVQGIFSDYEIGDATVPGGMRIKPAPPPMVWSQDADYWGEIRPPLTADIMPAPVAAGQTPVSASAPAESAGWSIPGPVTAAIALAAVGLALVVWPLRARIGTHRAPGAGRPVRRGSEGAGS